MLNENRLWSVDWIRANKTGIAWGLEIPLPTDLTALRHCQGASNVAVSSCPPPGDNGKAPAQLAIIRWALCRACCRKRLKGFNCFRSSGTGCSTTKCFPAESPSNHKAPMEATPTSTLPGTGMTIVRINPNAVCDNLSVTLTSGKLCAPPESGLMPLCEMLRSSSALCNLRSWWSQATLRCFKAVKSRNTKSRNCSKNAPSNRAIATWVAALTSVVNAERSRCSTWPELGRLRVTTKSWAEVRAACFIKVTNLRGWNPTNGWIMDDMVQECT